MTRLRLGCGGRDALRDPELRRVAHQPRDRRQGIGFRTVIQAVAVHHHHGHARLILQERGQRLGPGWTSPRARPRERQPGERPGELRVVAHVGGEVVAAGTAPYMDATRGSIPARTSRTALARCRARRTRWHGGRLTEPGARFRGGDRRAGCFEVDRGDDQRMQRPRQRARDLQEAGGQSEAHPRWLLHPSHGRPRPVGRVPTDPQDRSLTRGQVADQVLDHRVQMQGVAPNIVGDRRILHRQADEPGSDDLAMRGRRDRDGGDRGPTPCDKGAAGSVACDSRRNRTDPTRQQHALICPGTPISGVRSYSAPPIGRRNSSRSTISPGPVVSHTTRIATQPNCGALQATAAGRTAARRTPSAAAKRVTKHR